jgi:allantoin racemase
MGGTIPVVAGVGPLFAYWSVMTNTPQRCLLVINPNTTTAVSSTLQLAMQAASPPGVVVQTATARFGAPYISDEASYAVATHATLDAWFQTLAQNPSPAPDAVVVGCFGDPGLFALRALAPCPVVGLAEASLQVAATHGRCAVVTGGAAWRPMLERLFPHLSGGSLVEGVHTVALTGADIHRNPAAAEDALVQACWEALDRWPAVGSLVLGGAGLTGLAARLQPRVPVPLVDSVLAAVDRVWAQPPGAAAGLPSWWASVV